MRAPAPKYLLATLAAFCLLTIPGCLYGSQTKTSFRGQYINQQTYSRLQPGASEEDVNKLFGQPTTKTVRDDHETWRYHYTQATTKSGAVLFLFATSSETEHEGTVTVELVDAVVTKVTR